MRLRAAGALFVLVLTAGLGAACTADAGEEARKVIEANKEAVVTVQVVLETKMPYAGESEKEEKKVSATGTVVDPSGLVVAELSQVDPSAIMSQMEGETGNYQVNIVDAKIRTEDGTEIPADVVLRDRDLDLVFLRPKKALETPMKFVDLSQGAQPQAMDEVVVLWRLGQVANRVLAGDVIRVQAVVTKPRLSYAMNAPSLGCPVFSLDGRPVGTVVLRVSRGARDSGFFGGGNEIATMILPCSTVLKAAQQAKQAEPEKPAAESAPKNDSKPSSKPPAKSPAKPTPRAK
ncbi:MAG: hypothetical protein ACP5R5_10425 [Armatimonadota bacterium]